MKDPDEQPPDKEIKGQGVGGGGVGVVQSFHALSGHALLPTQKLPQPPPFRVFKFPYVSMID